VVLAILGIALARGALRGLVRETFSVASVGAAVAAVILFSGDTSLWLLRVTEGRIGEMAAPYAAGGLLAVLGVGATALTGRFLRRGATAVGLGWFDRTGGALLGTAEGLLLAGIVISGIGYVIGRDHPVLAESRSLRTLQEFEGFTESGEWPDSWPAVELPAVASGPPTRTSGSELPELHEVEKDFPDLPQQ
jgi:uncharacterized membrane protein required for colicin V production